MCMCGATWQRESSHENWVGVEAVTNPVFMTTFGTALFEAIIAMHRVRSIYSFTAH